MALAIWNLHPPSLRSSARPPSYFRLPAMPCATCAVWLPMLEKRRSPPRSSVCVAAPRCSQTSYGDPSDIVWRKMRRTTVGYIFYGDFHRLYNQQHIYIYSVYIYHIFGMSKTLRRGKKTTSYGSSWFSLLEWQFSESKIMDLEIIQRWNVICEGHFYIYIFIYI